MNEEGGKNEATCPPTTEEKTIMDTSVCEEVKMADGQTAEGPQKPDSNPSFNDSKEEKKDVVDGEKSINGNSAIVADSEVRLTRCGLSVMRSLGRK